MKSFNGEILGMEDLRALTGYSRPTYQAKALKQMGIPFRMRPDGSPVVFGADPIKDKLMQGDRCTPEGKFRVRDLYPHKKWSKFIWIDYPNATSWEKHKAAKTNGLIPQNAEVGGEIGIHGVPPGYDYAIDERMNWTLGCISLKNKHVDELYLIMIKGMLVEIE